MELTKKHLVRLYKKFFKTFYLLLIVILVLIKPYTIVTASHYSNNFNLDLSNNDHHHLNNIRIFLNNNINNSTITTTTTTKSSSSSSITIPNSLISNSTSSTLSTTIDLKKKLFIEYSPHFMYPPFGYGKLINPIDQSNKNFLSKNSTQFPSLKNKNRNFIKLSNKQSDHHHSLYFTTSSSSSPTKYSFYNQNHSGYHQNNSTLSNTKRINKNRTIKEQKSNTIRNNNIKKLKKKISNNNNQQSIIDISIVKLPQSKFNRKYQQKHQQYQHIQSKEHSNKLYSENAINLHQSKSNRLQLIDNIDNNIDVNNIYGIEFKRKLIEENTILSSLNSTNNKNKYNSLQFQNDGSTNNKLNNNNNQYFNQTYNSNNSIFEIKSSGKKIQRIKRRSINQDKNSEKSISSSITNTNNNNDNIYKPIINDYTDDDDDDVDDNVIDEIKNIQNEQEQNDDDDINRISTIKSTQIIKNTIDLNSKNNCNNIKNKILNNSSILLIEDCINNTNSTILNNFNKTIIHNNHHNNNNNNNDIHNNNQINTTLILNRKLQLLNNNNNNSDNLFNINNTFIINNNNNKINNNITILYDENIINNNLSINSNNSDEEECSLECDDCIPCNATYEEYMQYLYDYIYPSKSEWILIATHCVVFITGLVGNALVCVAVYTNYSMRTVTNVYIVNLAIADFFVILICLPPSVVWDVTETWFLGESMCKIVLYFQSISVTVSVLTLTFISVDRWYAICFPLRYRTKITRAVASVAFIWIVALVSDVPEFLALQIKPMNSKLRYETILFTQCQTTWDIETEKNFYIVRLVTLYLLPLLLMTIAYFKIVRVLWKSETIPGHRESRNQHQYSTCGYSRGSQMPASNTSTMGQLRARRKAAKMLVAVVIMFAVCYAPVHTFNLMRYTDTLPHNELTSIFSLLSHWLCYANSAINPIIYNFMSGKFRREFRNALEKCRCARVRVEDRSLNHSTPASRLNNVSPGSRSNYQLTSVRDITRDISRQTMQTTFVENYGNGHSAAIPMLNNEKKDQIT